MCDVFSYYMILNKLLLLIYYCSCYSCWSFYCFEDTEGNRFLRVPVVVTRAGLRRADTNEYHLTWEHTEGSCVGEKSNSVKKAPEIVSLSP